MSLQLRVKSVNAVREVKPEESLTSMTLKSSLPFINPKPFVFNGTEKAASSSASDRMSGSIDFVNLGGLPDRSVIMHPGANCTRCSKQASICMGCTSYLIDCSILHYRKTRALGARKLFDDAVVQAGATKVLKYVVFRVWRNGHILRMKEYLHRDKKSKKYYFDKNASTMFNAWRAYIKLEKLAARDKYTESLEAKVVLIEGGIFKLDQDNKFLQKKIEQLEALLNAKEKYIEQLLAKKEEPVVVVDEIDFSNVSG